jgi:Flp pilus assembly protein TadB
MMPWFILAAAFMGAHSGAGAGPHASYAPVVVAGAVLAYTWFLCFRIKRRQAKSRERREAE